MFCTIAKGTEHYWGKAKSRRDIMYKLSDATLPTILRFCSSKMKMWRHKWFSRTLNSVILNIGRKFCNHFSNSTHSIWFHESLILTSMRWRIVIQFDILFELCSLFLYFCFELYIIRLVPYHWSNFSGKLFNVHYNRVYDDKERVIRGSLTCQCKICTCFD